MSLAYTAPTWTDGSGEGISASNLQAISNCIEGLVQGSDKAVHGVSINGSVITLTYADGTTENFTAVDLKGIADVTESTSGLVHTFTITFTDGTDFEFEVTDGRDGTGQGDMEAADYDPSNTVKTAGGIPSYVTSAISGKADSSDLDDWTAEVTLATVGSDVVAVFDDLDNSFGYDLYGVDELLQYSAVSKTTGTNSGIKLTYTMSTGTSGVSKAVLRILK